MLVSDAQGHLRWCWAPPVEHGAVPTSLQAAGGGWTHISHQTFTFQVPPPAPTSLHHQPWMNSPGQATQALCVCVQLHETLADVPPDSMSMAQSRDISQQHGPKAAAADFLVYRQGNLQILGLIRQHTSGHSCCTGTPASRWPPAPGINHTPVAKAETGFWREGRAEAHQQTHSLPATPRGSCCCRDWLYQGRSDEAQLLAPAPSAWGLPQGGHFPATADQAPSLSPQTDPPTTSGKVKRGGRRNKMQNSKQG